MQGLGAKWVSEGKRYGTLDSSGRVFTSPSRWPLTTATNHLPTMACSPFWLPRWRYSAR